MLGDFFVAPETVNYSMGPVEVQGHRVAILHWRILVNIFLVQKV